MAEILDTRDCLTHFPRKSKYWLTSNFLRFENLSSSTKRYKPRLYHKAWLTRSRVIRMVQKIKILSTTKLPWILGPSFATLSTSLLIHKSFCSGPSKCMHLLQFRLENATLSWIGIHSKENWIRIPIFGCEMNLNFNFDARNLLSRIPLGIRITWVFR